LIGVERLALNRCKFN